MHLRDCPGCGLRVEAAQGVCPHCGALLDAPAVIDVSARAEDGSAADAPADPPRVEARPVFEEQVFSGRLWPGGPQFAGRTFVFRGGKATPAQGQGCCGCGCLLIAVAAFLIVRGLWSLF